MNKTLLIFIAFISLSCAKEKKAEKWKWNSEILTPVLLKENDTINYYLKNGDTLKAGEYFKAKLFRQFNNVKDSNNIDMVKDFKGFSFKILMNKDLNPHILKSWTNMKSYLKQIGDTAYIEIPVDSITKYADKSVRWSAEYRQIFHKDHSDTTYTIEGTWYLESDDAQ